jgi:hypothetical protein
LRSFGHPSDGTQDDNYFSAAQTIEAECAKKQKRKNAKTQERKNARTQERGNRLGRIDGF